MIPQIITFHSKYCDGNQHQDCNGAWIGFGFDFYCTCNCHLTKNDGADGFQGPNSAAPSQFSLEVTK